MMMVRLSFQLCTIHKWHKFSAVAVFQFSMMYYSVSEDSGIVSICLELVNGTLTEEIIIQVMVVNDSNDGMSGCE